MKAGTKYYTYNDNDELNIIRIIKIEDEDFTILINNKKKNVDKSFFSDYVKLNPDGRIFFNIVRMGDTGAKDVIVMVFKEDDLHNDIPNLSCRQCIYDSFASLGSSNIYMGLSLSRDQCPENIPYKSMLSCDESIYDESFSVYNNDTLDDIIDMVDSDEYDTLLKSMYDSNEVIDNNIRGFSRSLRDLLKDNLFMHDYRNLFNIKTLPFEISYDVETLEIDKELDKLNTLVGEEMFKTYVFKYTKEIDINSIKRSHIFVCDIKNNYYIIAYDKGVHLDRFSKNAISSTSNIIKGIKHTLKSNAK